MKLQKTEKVDGKSYTFRRLGCGPINMKRFGGLYLQMVEHKGKPRVVSFPRGISWRGDEKEFKTYQVISPSLAREMIGWLAKYIALSDPDPISLSIASTKAHANSIVREQANIAKELGL